MTRSNEIDRLLVDRISAGDADAWSDLIERYEGRLLAFVESRLSRRSASEDIVQDAFIGFLGSLPNYDRRRSLESYLFSICAYKMTDWLRREGRRPAIPLSSGQDSSGGSWQIPGTDRSPGSLAESVERQEAEEAVLAEVLAEEVDSLKRKRAFERLRCIEQLLVQGRSNKRIAKDLGMTEQKVASIKFEFLAKLTRNLKKQNIAREKFPELDDEQPSL